METILPEGFRAHLASLATTNPSKAALLSCDAEGNITEEISRQVLCERIDAAASYLSELSLKPGDRVALSFKNSPELLILSWAAWALGIVTVPLDTKRDTGELYKYKIELNKAKLLIAQKGVLKDIEPSYLNAVKVEEFSKFPDRTSSAVDWKKDLAHTALILFTSGTTGHPKGAKLTLENLIVNADGIREWFHITQDDRFLVTLPLHHINSTTFCLSTILAGGSIAIPPSYSNSHFWQQAAKTGSTFTSVVQSIVFDQLERGDEYDTAKKNLHLNRIQIGSAPVVAQTVEEFLQRFNIPLYQGYGQTETALRVTGMPIDLPQPLYQKLVEENSIGVPMSWADLQIADENGKILGEGEEGELVVKGAANMEGYVGNEPAFREGYFLTGDIGLYKVIEGQRFFFLKGRKREIIIKGGVNISPVAVENQLKKMSRDIDQVYVVAIPDQRYGEEVGAVICWKKNIDEEAAKRRVKMTLISGTAHLSNYETPRFLASSSVENLPTTSTGKVQRTILKDKIPSDQFESIYDLIQTPRYRFSILDPQSPHVAASHALYNQCWEPLTVALDTYRKEVSKQFILIALDQRGKLAGQIAFIRTNLSEEALLKTKHADLLSSEVSNRNGSAFVCISICSADYKFKLIPLASHVPDREEVRAYLIAGKDPVFKFHQRVKGGLAKGAELIDVISEGRPTDTSSLGYTMLLKYPAPSQDVRITDDAPVSNQLIEAVFLLGNDIGIKDVYAYSRPGGLAAYSAR
jgi:long-chain acyl-CoA synthetase